MVRATMASGFTGGITIVTDYVRESEPRSAPLV